MKHPLALITVLVPLSVPAVIITGQQVSPTEWTYTVTYEPWDNYAVCPAPGNVAVITLTGLAGVVSATAPTSTDIGTATSDTTVVDFFNSVNLAWVPEVLNGGTEVRWTHFGSGTGNWGVALHVFGFRVLTTAPAKSGTVNVTSEGFSIDVSGSGRCPVQPADDRDFSGTAEGPVAIPVLLVSIDINPGHFPNTINTSSKGNVPVAILSTPEFHAPSEVSPDSLTFGRTGNEHSLAFSTTTDVNGDGLLDLVCYFQTQLCGFQRGDTQGILKGQTLGGVPIEGMDSVTVARSTPVGRGGGRPPVGWSRR